MNIAPLIDHTLLKPDATAADIKRLCDEAKQRHLAGVCVNSCHIAQVAKALEGTSTKPVSVVGFPLGAMETTAKAFEARRACELGAQEIDMVINIGALKAGDTDLVTRDIAQVVEASRPWVVKVIIETCLLNHAEKILACQLAQKAGAHFVKTSTGFGGGGATIEDVALMRQTVGPHMGVKASGGIKTLQDVENMINAGANRIGTSTLFIQYEIRTM